jgi:hypothetical protein
MVRVFDRIIDNDDKGEKIAVELFYNETANILRDIVTDSEVNFNGKFISGPFENKQLKSLAMD